MVVKTPFLSDEDFFEFCQRYPRSRVERSADGGITVLPLRGLETSFRTCGLAVELGAWAHRDGRGKAFAAGTEFILPSGAARAPDASWLHNRRIATLTREQKRKFPRICPEFVVELTSPADPLNSVQHKMQDWIDNGVQLGWLLDPDCRTSYIYRPDRAPEKLEAPERLEGEGPVLGFVLDLEDIWAAL